MESHTSWKELHTFIGVINYHCNMCPKRSNMLAPLTKLLYIKRKFKWTKVEQDAFGKIKRIMACDTLSNYSDYNETFKIHTNARAFQLGVVISQKGKPIDIFIRNLTGTQQRYTVTYR